MIPSKADVDIKSTMQGEDIAMGIDQRSLVFLQKVLTDLYSDPELAVIREYSTNARDSHLEAGHNKPIEVITPTSFDPSLHIKDHGVGLSLDDIKNVYSLYGASTKRENAAANGMLGLGCKSALTYTNQFTIRSVKDGMLVIVMVTRDEFGAGAMKVLHHSPTNEPNGVEITIPAKSGNKFRSKAEEFFSYWEKSKIPVLLNGEPPTFIEASWVTENIAIRRENGYASNRVKVHMAGVTYGAEAGFDWRLLNIGYYTTVTFFVEDGAVDFTPSREELHYTARTNEKLKELSEQLKTELVVAMQKEIDAQPDHASAAKTFLKWRATFSNSPKFVYRGKSPEGTLAVQEEYKISRYGNNSYRDHTRPYHPTDILFSCHGDPFVIVTGKANKKLNSSQRAKLRTWKDNEDLEGEIVFLFVDKNTCSPWTDHIAHVTWPEILATKPKTNNNKSYSEPEHYVFTSGYKRRIDVAKEVDTTKPIAYAYLSDVNQSEESLIASLADTLEIGIYGVPKAKLKAFQKKYPSAEYYMDIIQKVVDAKFDEFTADEREFLQNYHSVHSLPQGFIRLDRSDVDKIADPTLKQMVKFAAAQYSLDQTQRNILAKFKTWNNLLDTARNANAVRTWKDEWRSLTRENPEYVKIGERYPLVRNGMNLDRIGRNHIVLYANAVYEDNQTTQEKEN